MYYTVVLFSVPSGINLIKRKAAAQFNPKLCIAVRDETVQVTRKMPIKEIKNDFKLDDEIDVNDDDHKYKVSYFHCKKCKSNRKNCMNNVSIIFIVCTNEEHFIMELTFIYCNTDSLMWFKY